MSNDLHSVQRLYSEVANALVKESRINSIFEKARENDEIFTTIFKFLLGYVAVKSLGHKEADFEVRKIRNRISNVISEENTIVWLDYCIEKTSIEHFLLDIKEVRECIGGMKLTKAFVKGDLIRRFFLRYLSSDVQKTLPSLNLKESNPLTYFLSGSEDDPVLAAETVYELIGAIRDKEDDHSVLLGFFEGFTMETGTPKFFTVKWSSAPMLQALVKANKVPLVHFYNSFTKTYLSKLRYSNSLEVGKLQKQYDQHFQMLLNLQSGMFHPGSTYDYGHLEK